MDSTAAAAHHVLRITGPQDAVIAVRVAVLHLALEQIGDHLEALVRVVGRAGGGARRVVHRAHLVDEQERVDLLEAAGRDRPADEKTTALEGLGGGDDAGERARSGRAGNGHGPPYNPAAVSTGGGCRRCA